MNRQFNDMTEKWAALYVRLSRDDENEGDSNSIAHHHEIYFWPLIVVNQVCLFLPKSCRVYLI